MGETNEVCVSDSTDAPILVVVDITTAFTFTVRVLFTKTVVVLACSESPKVRLVALLRDADVAFGEIPRIEDKGSVGSSTPRFDVYIVPADDQVEIRNSRP